MPLKVLSVKWFTIPYSFSKCYLIKQGEEAVYQYIYTWLR